MAKLDTEKRNDLSESKFAFPEQRKEPLENASHVRNAIARFNQVEGVSDDERDAAWKRIKAAAKKFGVEVGEGSWREAQGTRQGTLAAGGGTPGTAGTQETAGTTKPLRLRSLSPLASLKSLISPSYQTRQAFSRTIGALGAQLQAFWNSGLFCITPLTR